MKNICKFVSLILGLSLTTQAVHGAAVKTSFEAAKNSLSNLANTAAGKALVKNKNYVAAAAWLYFMYRVHKYLKLSVVDDLPLYFLIGSGPIITYMTLIPPGPNTKENLLVSIIGLGISYLVFRTMANIQFKVALGNSNDHEVMRYVNEAGSLSFILQSSNIVGAMRSIQHPVAIKQLIKAGALNSEEGRKALLQVHPKIAQQVFAGRHNALIAQLSQPATATQKRLPKHVAAHIASFDTGITVTQPMSATAAQALAAVDALKPDVANLDEILDAALKEWDE